jgi:hypothetical protein
LSAARQTDPILTSGFGDSMNKINIMMGIAALCVLSACGVKTSGVRSLSADTFTISAEDSDEHVAKGTALGLAEHHCKQRQQALLVTKTYKSHQMRYFYDVTFMCLNADDPRLENPQYETIYRKAS